MGRYAQARKRGRADGQAGFPFAAPTTGDFTVSPDTAVPGVTFTLDAEADGPAPGTVDGFYARWGDDNVSWTVIGPTALGNSLTTGVIGWGATGFIQIAWAIVTTRVSDWSPSQSSTHP